MADAQMNQFIDTLVSSGLAERDQIRALSSDIVDEVEADQGVTLPGAYRRFLTLAGGGAGRLWVGSDAFYPMILGVREAAMDLLMENGQPFQLPSDAVVIGMHQGYQFLFTTGNGDDPPVYRWVEPDDAPEQIAESLSEFLMLVAQGG